MNRMKILIAVHHFPPSFGGGAEWRAYRTAKGLQRKGLQVQAVCVESMSYGDGGTLDYTDTLYDGIPVRRLRLDLAQDSDAFRWSYRNTLIEQHFTVLLKEFEPDVLHLIGGYLMTGSVVEAAQIARIPVVLTLTDFWFICPRITLIRSDGTLCRTVPTNPLECLLCLCKGRRRYRVSDRLSCGLLGYLLLQLWQLPGVVSFWGQADLARGLQERRAYLLHLLNSVDAVISPSRFLKDLFTEQGVHPCRFIYCRQGVNLQDWAPVELTPTDSRLRIGYIGQIAKHKGVDILVKAFCQLREEGERPKLLLYGDVAQFPAFVRQIRKQIAGRDDITLAGRFDNTQVGQIHAGLDVLVVPSVWYENSPNVILEAFAAGTPVITSDQGGLAELVRHEVNGLLFRMGDTADLAHQLQRIVDQPALLRTLRKGIQPVKTVQEEIAELTQVYREVIVEAQT